MSLSTTPASGPRASLASATASVRDALSSARGKLRGSTQLREDEQGLELAMLSRANEAEAGEATKAEGEKVKGEKSSADTRKATSTSTSSRRSAHSGSTIASGESRVSSDEGYGIGMIISVIAVVSVVIFGVGYLAFCAKDVDEKQLPQEVVDGKQVLQEVVDGKQLLQIRGWWYTISSSGRVNLFEVKEEIKDESMRIDRKYSVTNEWKDVPIAKINLNDNSVAMASGSPQTDKFSSEWMAQKGFTKDTMENFLRGHMWRIKAKDTKCPLEIEVDETSHKLSVKKYKWPDDEDNRDKWVAGVPPPKKPICQLDGAPLEINFEEDVDGSWKLTRGDNWQTTFPKYPVMSYVQGAKSKSTELVWTYNNEVKETWVKTLFWNKESTIGDNLEGYFDGRIQPITKDALKGKWWRQENGNCKGLVKQEITNENDITSRADGKLQFKVGTVLWTANTLRTFSWTAENFARHQWRTEVTWTADNMSPMVWTSKDIQIKRTTCDETTWYQSPTTPMKYEFVEYDGNKWDHYVEVAKANGVFVFSLKGKSTQKKMCAIKGYYTESTDTTPIPMRHKYDRYFTHNLNVMGLNGKVLNTRLAREWTDTWTKVYNGFSNVPAPFLAKGHIGKILLRKAFLLKKQGCEVENPATGFAYGLKKRNGKEGCEIESQPPPGLKTKIEKLDLVSINGKPVLILDKSWITVQELANGDEYGYNVRTSFKIGPDGSRLPHVEVWAQPKTTKDLEGKWWDSAKEESIDIEYNGALEDLAAVVIQGSRPKPFTEVDGVLHTSHNNNWKANFDTSTAGFQLQWQEHNGDMSPVADAADGKKTTVWTREAKNPAHTKGLLAVCTKSKDEVVRCDGDEVKHEQGNSSLSSPTTTTKKVGKRKNFLNLLLQHQRTRNKRRRLEI